MSVCLLFNLSRMIEVDYLFGGNPATGTETAGTPFHSGINLLISMEMVIGGGIESPTRGFSVPVSPVIRVSK